MLRLLKILSRKRNAEALQERILICRMDSVILNQNRVRIVPELSENYPFQHH